MNTILASTRSIEHLSKRLNSSSELNSIINSLYEKLQGKDTLGSLLGTMAQRIHSYIPLIEVISFINYVKPFLTNIFFL